MARASLLSLAVFFAWSAAPADLAPGSMKLLPGYNARKLQGTDSLVGTVSKDDGLTIHYDIGFPAGNQVGALNNDQVAWRKDQTLDGHRVTSAMTKDRTLYVTFPDDWANFNGKVSTDEDLADFLLMVLTYTPQKPGK